MERLKRAITEGKKLVEDSHELKAWLNNQPEVDKAYAGNPIQIWPARGVGKGRIKKMLAGNPDIAAKYDLEKIKYDSRLDSYSIYVQGYTGKRI